MDGVAPARSARRRYRDAPWYMRPPARSSPLTQGSWARSCTAIPSAPRGDSAAVSRRRAAKAPQRAGKESGRAPFDPTRDRARAGTRQSAARPSWLACAIAPQSARFLRGKYWRLNRRGSISWCTAAPVWLSGSVGPCSRARMWCQLCGATRRSSGTRSSWWCSSALPGSPSRRRCSISCRSATDPTSPATVACPAGAGG